MKRFEKVFEPKVALPLITLIAAVFRVIPLRYKYEYKGVSEQCRK